MDGDTTDEDAMDIIRDQMLKYSCTCTDIGEDKLPKTSTLYGLI